MVISYHSFISRFKTYQLGTTRLQVSATKCIAVEFFYLSLTSSKVFRKVGFSLDGMISSSITCHILDSVEL